MNSASVRVEWPIVMAKGESFSLPVFFSAPPTFRSTDIFLIFNALMVCF
jgi:hypothetical protein